MLTVNTTEGILKIEDLGKTLIHEHVLVGYPGWYMDNRFPAYKRAEIMPRIVDAFSQLHAYGVKTVVDPCPMDMGRDVEICAEVAQRSGINIICTTGVYTEDMGITFTFKHLAPEAITEIYVKEIEQGIGHTGIKAGAIKIATGDGKVTPYERKMLSAAAEAAKITGVPLISHTENCTCGHDQVDIITGCNVPSHRLLVGHCDGIDDPDYQSSIAARGSYVGFDRFGIEIMIADAIRMKNLKIMVERGHKDRIMMSHDRVNCFMGPLPIPGVPDGDALDKIVPNWRMTHLFENIQPQLAELGVSKTDFDYILTENPRRFFSGQV